EKACLVDAFGQGLLSYIEKPFTAETFTAQVKYLERVCNDSEWDDARVAAQYLRDFLKKSAQVDLLVELEKSITIMYPDVPTLHLGLAEAFYLSRQHK